MSVKIGITCKRNDKNVENYINTTGEFGGEPILLASLERPISEHLASIPEYLDEIDGLLLPGGGDIDPCRFNELRYHVRGISMVEGVSKSRDALEIQLFQKALEADIPVFGICRGIQVMNVAMDGNLFQDIPSQLPLQFADFPIHKVKVGDSQHDIKIKTGSLLNQIIGERTAKVNSRHHQAVKVISEGFVVTAQSPDGIIEAVEDPSKQFVVGVQYHPERMLETEEFREHRRKLFEAFIKAASE
jgi:putative glutamine amidotransferase